MMAPVRPVHLRMYVIDALMNEPKAKDIISTLVFINVEVNTDRNYSYLGYIKPSEI